MTTINTIEQRILQMDGGEFQKLCDAYLFAIGYRNPHSFGSVTGSNKVKQGTPDTFFERTDGKLVFAEYTTQKTDLFGKLSNDLGKCFNEKKTEVPVSNLAEIVICYTNQLQPNQVLSLKAKCKKKGVDLNLFGLSTLANDLFLHHSLLVRNFLNLAIDTGQVIPLESFPIVYSKSKFATTLETKFHFREKEIEDFSSALESDDLVVVFGKAGVGKSRFALEGCRGFIAKHTEYQAFATVSLSQSLFEDLQERFLSPGDFLILVDDANRVIDFSYFIHILRNKKDNQKIKIVVTVRDYALEKIEKDIDNYPHKEIQLDRFSDDQIKEIAKDEFSILNPFFLERIVDISGGNPRIAVMISKVAIENNSLKSINDVSSLYDEYFSSIKEDLLNFGDINFRKTAGIIAFLRVVDRTNDEMMLDINKSFGVSPDVFWESASCLHDLEMVDMYENEVVRISDQVLSTYLFYLTFFKEKVLDFSDILQNYFPHYRSRIIDSLYPVLSAFDATSIYNLIRPKVEKIWDKFQTNNDNENLLILTDSFWNLLPTETLSFIQNRLSQHQFAPADFSQLEQQDANKRKNVTMITELQILGRFRYTNTDLINIALEILLNYLSIYPADLLPILHILVDYYGFDRFTSQTGVSLQQEINDLLWGRAINGKDELFSRLFISVSEEFLKTTFETNEYRNKNTVTFYTFELVPSPEIFSLRGNIINNLIELYKQDIYQNTILTSLKKYVKNYSQSPQTEIFTRDSVKLISFIQNYMSADNYEHNIFINEYLNFLEHHQVPFDVSLRLQFTNDAYKVFQLITENHRIPRNYNYDEQQRNKKECFISYFADFIDSDAKHFVDLCTKMGNEIIQSHEKYDFISGFCFGLNVLAEFKPDLFELSLRYYLQQGDILLLLDPNPLIRTFLTTNDKDRTLAFLNNIDLPTKARWLFSFYQVLPPNKVGAEDLTSLYKLFEITECPQLPNDLNFLLRYTSFDRRFVAKITKIILDKCAPQDSAWALSSITNPYSDVNKDLMDLFRDDFDTLKRIYLIIKAEKGQHDDHNSVTLSKILELDPEFIIEYIDWIYTPNNEIFRLRYHYQDYSILWKNKNFRTILLSAINHIYKIEISSHLHNNIKQFFISDENKRLDADIEQRQEEIITELLKLHSQDMNFIEYLFEVIAYFPQERRSRSIFTFIQLNKNLADFQRLELESRVMSWSGSAVPVYQGRINFYKSLLPMFNNAQLLGHRNYIENHIKSLEGQMNMEKKRDFIGE